MAIAIFVDVNHIKGKKKLGERVNRLVFLGDFLVVVLKVLYPWKSLSPEQTGQLVTLHRDSSNMIQLVLSALVKSISRLLYRSKRNAVSPKLSPNVAS